MRIELPVNSWLPSYFSLLTASYTPDMHSYRIRIFSTLDQIRMPLQRVEFLPQCALQFLYDKLCEFQSRKGQLECLCGKEPGCYRELL